MCGKTSENGRDAKRRRVILVTASAKRQRGMTRVCRVNRSRVERLERPRLFLGLDVQRDDRQVVAR